MLHIRGSLDILWCNGNIILYCENAKHDINCQYPNKNHCEFMLHKQYHCKQLTWVSVTTNMYTKQFGSSQWFVILKIRFHRIITIRKALKTWSHMHRSFLSDKNNSTKITLLHYIKNKKKTKLYCSKSKTSSNWC